MENQKSSPPRKAGLIQVALAIFWGFFGVRKHKNWQADAVNISPLQIIIGGIIGLVIFVFALIMIVRIVTS